MRLIDADKLNFEQLQDTHNEAVPALEYIAFLKGAIAAEEIVKNAPTIDAEPVVHCKNCVHNIKEYGMKVCAISGRQTDNGFYCYYGHQKDEEG